MNSAPLEDLVRNTSLLESIAAAFGTPVYLYSAGRIRNNINRLCAAMETHLPRFQLLYAAKANQNPALLRLMRDSDPNIGVDCSSPGELTTALNAGYSADRLIYTGNYESEADLASALEQKIPVNFDDITSYQRCREIGLPEVVSFRVNPGEGRGAFPGITTAGKDVKFGVPREEIVDAYGYALEDGVTRFGLHTMVGSGILENDYFPWNCQRLLEIAAEIQAIHGIHFEFIDLGGGFGIPYRETDQPLDLDQIFQSVGSVVRSFYDKDTTPVITYELGRYIVGDSGCILSRVTGTKESDKYFVGLDIGMNHFIRPALYDAYHRIIPIGDARERPNRPTEITGQICENTDRTARDRRLPELQCGDLVAIMDTGAYGFCFASQYNGRPLPGEVLVNEGTSTLIRQRESLDDLNRNVIVPDWLQR